MTTTDTWFKASTLEFLNFDTDTFGKFHIIRIRYIFANQAVSTLNWEVCQIFPEMTIFLKSQLSESIAVEIV